MLYLCEVCGYKTNRLLNFKRHEARMTPCKNRNKNIDMENGNNHNDQNVVLDDQNVVLDDQNVVHEQTEYKCKKCNKTFSRKQRLLNHEAKCDGVTSLQCKICLKVFVTRQGKHKHIQYVKCQPPQQNITNNINNNITINNTIITRLPFGKENLDEMFTDPEYMKKMLAYVVEGNKNSLIRSMEDIYFNDKYPYNQTIKKTRKNGDILETHEANGKWRPMIMEDVYPEMIRKIEDYYDPFFEEMKNKVIPKDHPRYKQMLRFVRVMREYGWDCDSIEDCLRIILDEKDAVDEDPRKLKQLMKLMMYTMYEHYEETIQQMRLGKFDL